ncbi:hypothetical protein GCG21_06900 [Pseudactinotalea sp. HY160]|uniref:cell wall-binding repeat-containing protein n=1 Tax=Pseudactinotalea sp. HY160 TaxID=2654490 RepID=UPI00128B925D|nr:cell wall-binding repeat-containing protein [Pseudactinotalea sp. HY160]MPV49737.1 hypothetical protein [Pseudactinotalea sp. HY160]
MASPATDRRHLPRRRRSRARPARRRPGATLALLTGMALLVAGCSGGVTLDPEPGVSHAVRSISVTHEPESERISGSDPAELALAASQSYFEAAQVVVLAPVDEPGAILRAASIGAVAGVPVLLTPPPGESTTPSDTATPGELNTELVRLGTRAVLTVGAVSLADVDTTALIVAPDPGDDEALGALLGREVTSVAPPEPEDAVQALARLGEDEVFAAPEAGAGPDAYGSMPETLAAEPLAGAVVITRDEPVLVAAAGTAAGAGARLLVGSEPLRGDADLIGALGESAVTSLVALGTWSMPRAELDVVLDAVRTGVQLPGGGQLIFGSGDSSIRYVSLYGSIQTDKLGTLGAQDAAATMTRVIGDAAAYTAAWDDQVVPAVEILVTVASEEPGTHGKYSHMWPAADIEPWIERAEQAGVLVLLAFQPGRYSFLDQVREYETLLAHPNVGVRLEPGWRYETDARARDREGSVDAGEVNDLISYLSAFVAAHDLPQKLVSVSESTAGQVRHRGILITDDPRIPVLINVDVGGDAEARGKGWRSVRADAPAGLAWGVTIPAKSDPPVGPAEVADLLSPVPDWVSRR